MATLAHETATDRKLLSRGKLISDSLNEIPRTSRYAFDNSKPPSRQGLHSRSASFPQRSSKAPFFVRHNPHPKRVIHLKGLLDVPVCTVIDSNSHEDPERFLVRTPALPSEGARFRGLRMPLNSTSFVTCKEKALPGIGLVPITQTWRDELAKLTEAAGLRKRHPTISKTGLLQPPGSRQSERPIASREGVNGDVPPSRNGDKPRTPANHDIPPPASRQCSREAFERPLEHIMAVTDNEGWVMETLCNILQTDSITAVQSWLVNAPSREKELVLDMIRAISTSDYEFREGYQQAVRSPIYEDQLLQHESTLDIDAIREFNEAHGRKSKKSQDERQGTPSDERQRSAVEELQKPRTPAAQNGAKSTNDWSASELKPSSPFRPRPSTTDAQVEEIRSKLESRCSPCVFSHQSRVPPSRHSSRAPSQQSVYVPPAQSLEAVAQRPPSHQSIKSQQSVLKSILEYKPEKE